MRFGYKMRVKSRKLLNDPAYGRDYGGFDGADLYGDRVILG